MLLTIAALSGKLVERKSLTESFTEAVYMNKHLNEIEKNNLLKMGFLKEATATVNGIHLSSGNDALRSISGALYFRNKVFNSVITEISIIQKPVH